jgi:hypothetical protein
MAGTTLEDLQALIRERRRRNLEYRYFVPHQALYNLMTEDFVEKAVLVSNIPRYHMKEVIKAIMDGARKIFAILILIRQSNLIFEFIQDDQLQLSSLDHKLPFSIEKLQTLLPNLDTATRFYETQWEFAAPIFTGSLCPRVLESEVILPFIGSEEIGEGGFGLAYVTKLESTHQGHGGVIPHTVRWTSRLYALEVLICVADDDFSARTERIPAQID